MEVEVEEVVLECHKEWWNNSVDEQGCGMIATRPKMNVRRITLIQVVEKACLRSIL